MAHAWPAHWSVPPATAGVGPGASPLDEASAEGAEAAAIAKVVERTFVAASLGMANEDPAKVESEVMDVVRGHFRPEFLNRLDEIILFHRLSASHMAPIVDLQVARLQKLLDERKITLELSEKARAWLGRVGYDPVYGARPLKRAVQRHLQDPLADRILSGAVPDGSTVKVDEGDGALTFDGQASANG